jgi:hypothetical protein
MQLINQHKMEKMKKFILFLSILASGLMSFAQEKKLVISAGELKHVQLGDNMNVTLVSADQATELKGDMVAFEKLNLSVSNGILHIQSRQSLSADEKVYIVVGDLQTLSIGQNTSVTSENVLTSKELKVLVMDGSTARLKTIGKIAASAADGYEVSVKRTVIELQRPVLF